MKRSNRYNKFVLYGNAPVCAYGNKIVRAPYRVRRVRLVFFFKVVRGERATA